MDSPPIFCIQPPPTLIEEAKRCLIGRNSYYPFGNKFSVQGNDSQSLLMYQITSKYYRLCSNLDQAFELFSNAPQHETNYTTRMAYFDLTEHSHTYSSSFKDQNIGKKSAQVLSYYNQFNKKNPFRYYIEYLQQKPSMKLDRRQNGVTTDLYKEGRIDLGNRQTRIRQNTIVESNANQSNTLFDRDAPIQKHNRIFKLSSKTELLWISITVSSLILALLLLLAYVVASLYMKKRKSASTGKYVVRQIFQNGSNFKMKTESDCNIWNREINRCLLPNGFNKPKCLIVPVKNIQRSQDKSFPAWIKLVSSLKNGYRNKISCESNDTKIIKRLLNISGTKFRRNRMENAAGIEIDQFYFYDVESQNCVGPELRNYSNIFYEQAQETCKTRIPDDCQHRPYYGHSPYLTHIYMQISHKDSHSVIDFSDYLRTFHYNRAAFTTNMPTDKWVSANANNFAPSLRFKTLPHPY